MIHLTEIPGRQIAPGYLARVIHGNLASLSVVEIKKGSVLPEHHHHHEQITFMVRGQLDMMIGGKPYSLTDGMLHVIPSNVPHSAVAATDCLVVDAFSPVRDDYK